MPCYAQATTHANGRKILVNGPQHFSKFSRVLQCAAKFENHSTENFSNSRNETFFPRTQITKFIQGRKVAGAVTEERKQYAG
jgi:hypothetical protein